MAEPAEPGARRLRAVEARARLLAAAMKEFSERPYDQVGVDELTRAAGTAHGSLFHYFESKRGIYLAAMEAIAARLRERRARNADARAGVRRELEAHFGAIAEHPETFVTLMRGGVGADPEAQQVFERDRWDAIEHLAAQLGLDASNPAVRVSLRGCIGAADHAVLAWLEHGRPFPLSRLIESFLATLDGALGGLPTLDPRLDTAAARAALRAEARPRRLERV